MVSPPGHLFNTWQHLARLGDCSQIPSPGRPQCSHQKIPAAKGTMYPPSKGPCASTHEVASLCLGDRKYPCGSGGRAWHGTPTISNGLQAGSLTPSVLCPSELGRGVEGSSSCLHVVPGCSLQGSLPLNLLDSRAADPKERVCQPASLETSVPILATVQG